MKQTHYVLVIIKNNEPKFYTEEEKTHKFRNFDEAVLKSIAIEREDPKCVAYVINWDEQ